MVAQTNHQITKCSKNKIDMVICFRIGKTYTEKTSASDFKITTLKNPLLSQQAITSKGITILYTNLQLDRKSVV